MTLGLSIGLEAVVMDRSDAGASGIPAVIIESEQKSCKQKKLRVSPALRISHWWSAIVCDGRWEPALHVDHEIHEGNETRSLNIRVLRG